MDNATILSLISAAVILLFAFVYSLAGQAGGCGYLAVMALIGMPNGVSKPNVLLLNIAVSLVAAGRFCREGFFSWKSFWPFASSAVAMSFAGGILIVPTLVHRIVLMLVILFGAARLFFRIDRPKKERPVPIAVALIAGGLIGFISGMTGVGGGVFLSPLLLWTRWSSAEESLGISASFSLVNSLAALAANGVATVSPDQLVYWVPVALVGAWLGTERRLQRRPILSWYSLLALVLGVGAIRALISG